MTPDLNAALSSVFNGNGVMMAVRREPTPYITTFFCEIATCRFRDGDELRLFCKYGPRDGACSFGQRGGVAYEAEVYRCILHPLRVSTPAFYGSHTDPHTGGTWLILEYLSSSLRAGKVPGLEAIKESARWIAGFHSLNEVRLRNGGVSLLARFDAAWYRAWPRRAFEFARRASLPLPWLEQIQAPLEEEIGTLATLPFTVVHGEYYPHNILFQDGRIRPVDWETAAIGPGEIDLATLTEGWSPEERLEIEAEYRQARWPAGAPPDFERNLALARAYVQLRWLGDDDPKKSSDMFRWEQLQDASQRLGLISSETRGTTEPVAAALDSLQDSASAAPALCRSSETAHNGAPRRPVR